MKEFSSDGTMSQDATPVCHGIHSSASQGFLVTLPAVWPRDSGLSILRLLERGHPPCQLVGRLSHLCSPEGHELPFPDPWTCRRMHGVGRVTPPSRCVVASTTENTPGTNQVPHSRHCCQRLSSPLWITLFPSLLQLRVAYFYRCSTHLFLWSRKRPRQRTTGEMPLGRWPCGSCGPSPPAPGRVRKDREPIERLKRQVGSCQCAVYRAPQHTYGG